MQDNNPDVERYRFSTREDDSALFMYANLDPNGNSEGSARALNLTTAKALQSQETKSCFTLQLTLST